jgi:hypothetical protein
MVRYVDERVTGLIDGRHAGRDEVTVKMHEFKIGIRLIGAGAAHDDGHNPTDLVELLG